MHDILVFIANLRDVQVFGAFYITKSQQRGMDDVEQRQYLWYKGSLAFIAQKVIN